MRKFILILGLVYLNVFVYAQEKNSLKEIDKLIDDPIPISFWQLGLEGIYYNGNVGIGTSLPSYKLHAAGDIYANGGWVRVSGAKGLYFQSYGGGFYMTDNTWIRTYGNKSFYHNSGTMRTDGTFQVGPNGDRFIVNTSGNTGIGTTNPDFKLQIENSIAGDGGWTSGVNIKSSNSTAGEAAVSYNNISTGTNHWITGLNQNANYRIAYGSSFTDSNIKMTITTDGKLGVGTTAPSHKLEVNGNIYTHNELVLKDASGTDHILGDDASGETSGMVLRTSANPSSGDPIFVVESSGYSQRLRVEHDGAVKTSNILEVDGTGNSYFAGNLGIGTTSPSQKLDVNGNLNITGNLYQNGSLVDLSEEPVIWQLNTTNAYYNNTGNVGIGTTTPSKKLDVNGDVNFTGNLYKNGSLVDLNSTSLWQENGTNIYYNGGNIGIGTSNPEGILDINTSNSGRILFENGDHNFRVIDANGNSVFRVNDLDGSQNNQLVVASTGVGIGIEAPHAKLDVAGNVRLSNNMAGIESNLGFYILSYEDNGSENGLDNIKIGVDDSPATDIEFWTPGAGGSAMSINNSGNVGIGITSPTKKLDINGDINFSGNIYKNGELVDFSVGGITSLWSQSGTDIYFNTGKVGIGTISPSKNLDLQGNFGLNGELFLESNESNINIGQIELTSGPKYLNFYTDESVRMTIDDSGLIGIGTQYPSSDIEIVRSTTPVLTMRTTGTNSNYVPQLQLVGYAQGENIGAVNFYHSDNFDENMPDAAITANSPTTGYGELNFYTSNDGVYNNRMKIKTNGNVGIGTDNPQKTFEVYGEVLLGNKENQTYIDLFREELYLYSTSNVIIGDGHQIGNGVKFEVTDRMKEFKFENGDIKILNGNVGVGSVAPETNFHIKSTITDGNIIKIESKTQNPGDEFGIVFENGWNTETARIAAYQEDYNQGSGGLRFFTSQDATLQNQMTIDDEGNVGIGTSNPSKKLDVNGDINFTGDLYKNGEPINMTGAWQQSESDIYFDTGKVGIGREPYGNYLLTVNGETYFKNRIFIDSPTAEGLQIIVEDGTSGVPDILIEDDFIGTGIHMENYNFHIKTDDQNRMTVLGNGNVGIGTSSPEHNLDIYDNSPVIRLKSNKDGTNATGYLEFYDVNSLMGFVGFRTNYTNHLYIANESSGDIIMPYDNLGIGTSAPTSRLDIVSSSAPIIKLRGDDLYETGQIPKFEFTGSNVGDYFGEINFINGYTGCYNAEGPHASIKAYADTDRPDQSNLVFFTADDHGTLIQSMVIKHNGNVRIGTTNIPSGYKLAVDGPAIFEEVVVELSENWADFVFEDNYDLMSLSDLKAFIKDNKHLPEIPTTKEVEENGISVGEMNAKLLQKVEELTLYTIQQEDKINNQQEVINELLKRVEQLENK